MANGDRNLLFGILALQLEVIGRDDLIAAMHAWALDRARPLGQILVERGSLRPDLRDCLEEVIRRSEEPCGTAPQPAPAAPQALAPRAGVDDPYPTRDFGPGPSAGLRQRYRILRPYARGGLGEVFVAQDEELHREVALKEILSSHAEDPEARSRFLVEAEITGRLEHPGIVPVYGLGQHLDGRPFYTMRLIKGDSLKDAIDRFHKADAPGRPPDERSLALRKLISHFLDVCNAIAYAHSRGILHRDLKPNNILLGQYGETVVVDWGLAKTIGREEDLPHSGEGLLRPSRNAGPAPTQLGRIVGTPEFMSPEQAAGQLDQLGPASDVYSLGATFYCLLTGRAPFEGEVGDLLRRVRGGDFPAPRQVNASVPEDLEAICLKAMQFRPEDRHTSAAALAQDLERWLAEAPASPPPESWSTRVGQWAQHHNTLTAGVALLVLTTLLGLWGNAGGSRRARTDAGPEAGWSVPADGQVSGRAGGGSPRSGHAPASGGSRPRLAPGPVERLSSANAKGERRRRDDPLPTFAHALKR